MQKTRRSTCRIALVEFGNSIRIAWVASFSNCFIDAHSSVSVNAGGATCSSKELQVAPTFPLIGPMPDSRYPIDIVKCGRCNLQLQRAASCTDISTHRRCPIADSRSTSLNAGGATCRRRAASCTDISTYRRCRGGVGWGRYRVSGVPVLDPVLDPDPVLAPLRLVSALE